MSAKKRGPRASLNFIVRISVITGTTDFPADDTVPQITEGNQVVTLPFTPLSATSRLYFFAVSTAAVADADKYLSIGLWVQGTANALIAERDRTQQPFTRILNLVHDVASGSTNARTYEIRVGSNGTNTVTINGQSSARIFGGVCLSKLMIIEIEEV